MAQRFQCRPSGILRITDDYAAFCFDEVCCWIIAQMEDGKRPFFGRGRNCGNARTLDILRNLGAEVKCID